MTIHHFAILDISFTLTATNYIITVTTNVPCHLWLRHTTTKPIIHMDPRFKRGLPISAEPRFCFVVYADNEQFEIGDTLTHTFLKPDWPICETWYIYFWGTIGGQPSPSESPIFTNRRPHPSIEATFLMEEELGATNTVGRDTAPPGEDWPTLKSGSGNRQLSFFYATLIKAGAFYGPDKWERLFRGVVSFDTSPIPPTATILKAILSFYGKAKQDTFSPTIAPAANIYSITPTSPPFFFSADYNHFGSTPLSTPIAYPDIVINGWNDYVLNAIGRGLISTPGITYFGLRDPIYDVPGIAPAWSTGTADIRFGRNPGEEAKLVVTYADPCP